MENSFKKNYSDLVWIIPIVGILLTPNTNFYNKIYTGLFFCLIAVFIAVIKKEKYKTNSIILTYIGLSFFSILISGYYSELTESFIKSTLITLICLTYCLTFITANNKHQIIKNIENIIIVISIITLIGVFIEIFLIKSQAGKIFIGNQNLSAALLVCSMPILMQKKVFSYWLKLAIILLITLLIAFILKSRISTFLAIIYISYTVGIRCLANKNKIITFIIISIIGLVCASILIISFDRFSELITGNTIFLRYYSWQRILQIFDLNKLIFGYGPGAISIVFSQGQYINSQIEIITGLATFHSAHNYLIDSLVSGGLFLFLPILAVNFILIYGYTKYNNKNNLKHIFAAYLILFLQAQFDIHNQILVTLMVFTLLQFSLLAIIYDVRLVRINYTSMILGACTVLSIVFLISKDYFYDHIHEYKKFSQKFIKNDLDNEGIKNFNKIAPHFMRIDFFDMYNYLIYNSGNSFDRIKFEEKLLLSNKFNRYFIPQMHISSQYYSFYNIQEKILNIYSDLLYIELINSGFNNISVKDSQVRVRVGEVSNIHFIRSNNELTMVIPYILFEELKKINSSFGLYKLDKKLENHIIENFVYTNQGDYQKIRESLKKFLEKVNSFSERFVI